jgi:hypothetical protein
MHIKQTPHVAAKHIISLDRRSVNRFARGEGVLDLRPAWKADRGRDDTQHWYFCTSHIADNA